MYHLKAPQQSYRKKLNLLKYLEGICIQCTMSVPTPRMLNYITELDDD